MYLEIWHSHLCDCVRTYLLVYTASRSSNSAIFGAKMLRHFLDFSLNPVCKVVPSWINKYAESDISPFMGTCTACDPELSSISLPLICYFGTRRLCGSTVPTSFGYQHNWTELVITAVARIPSNPRSSQTNTWEAAWSISGSNPPHSSNMAAIQFHICSQFIRRRHMRAVIPEMTTSVMLMWLVKLWDSVINRPDCTEI